MHTTLIHPETINGHTVAIAEPIQIGEVPVIMFVTPCNRLMALGNPETVTLSSILKYLERGCIIRQVTHKELANVLNGFMIKNLFKKQQMKYVAKVDHDNYLFSLSKDEVLVIMFGELRPQYDESKKKEVYNFIEKLNSGKIDLVTFSTKFSRIMNLYETSKRFDEWGGFARKMDEIKEMFEPVKEYIEKFKEVGQ